MSAESYSNIDLHSWNISRERFLELVAKCHYKIDESKIKATVLLSNVQPNTLRHADFTIQYVKSHRLSPEEIKKATVKEKLLIDKLLALGIAAARQINHMKNKLTLKKRKKLLLYFWLALKAKFRKKRRSIKGFHTPEKKIRPKLENQKVSPIHLAVISKIKHDLNESAVLIAQQTGELPSVRKGVFFRFGSNFNARSALAHEEPLTHGVKSQHLTKL